MKLRSVTINKRFIPEWNENKSLPATEQLIINFSRIPGTSEKSTYKGFRINQSGGMELVYNDNLLCSSFVSKIENLEIGPEGAEVKIKTGAELATASHPALGDLFVEIRNYLFPEDEELTAGESTASQ
jgi:hypothetical protein